MYTKAEEDSCRSIVEISSEEDLMMIEQETTPERSPRVGRNLLKQLSSSLSPKYTGIEKHENARLSRFGRHQKTKDLQDGFVPSELTRFVSKSGAKMQLVTFNTLRIIKTPTKIVPENALAYNNNAEEKIKVADEGIVMKKSVEQLMEDENSSLSQLDAMEQLSDVDSGRGSVVDAEFAALMTQFPEGGIYWAEYKVGYFWPCIIGPDPEGIPIRNDPRSKFCELHVKYFGDKRAWVTHNKLQPYKPLQELKKSHKLNSNLSGLKGFLPSIGLADSFVSIPMEQRLAKLYEHEELQKKQEKPKTRKSKELLNRSATPESPAFEDITGDADSIKSDLELIRELAIPDKKRKEIEEPEVHPKRVRYSRRTLELKSRPKVEVSASLNVSLPAKISKPKKEKVENAENEGLSIEERLRNEFMTKDFNFRYMYPDYAIKKEYVCRLCFHTGDLKKCGGCNGHFHEECIAKVKQGQPLPQLKRGPIGTKKTKYSKYRPSVSSVKTEDIDDEEEEETATRKSDDSSITCTNCEENSHKCFICKVKGESGELVQCSYNRCFRMYHKSCVASFPQTTTMAPDRIICSIHKCHTCFAADAGSITSDKKLVMCVMCPVSYHYNDVNCIPAGTEWLTTTQIICQNHSVKPPTTKVNVNWCFICTKGGDLVCCETCPGAFHLACLNEKEITQEKYVCDSCSSGKKPLHNELVWAKIGHYRFWPAIVLSPQTAPLSMINKTHYPGDFCVKFFGTRDCAWVGRDRVFCIEDEDMFAKIPDHKGGLDGAFSKALHEAKIVHKMLQAEKGEIKRVTQNNGKPERYVKIKTNLAVKPCKLEMDINTITKKYNLECECKPDDPDPCGYTSQCHNRAVMQECLSNSCPAKEKCQNQVFQKKLYPKVQERYTQSRGWGLFAEEDILKGTFIIEYVGELINTEEMNRRMDECQKNKIDNFYFMNLGPNQIIDAGKKGNLARFINHSCMPNCETEIWQVGRTSRVGIFALSDIKKDEELSFDYQLECMGNVQKRCMCGTEECRGVIGPKKRDARHNSSESTSKTTSKKRKKGFSLKIKINKKQKTSHKAEAAEVPLISETLSTSMEIDDELEVKAANFVPADVENDTVEKL